MSRGGWIVIGVLVLSCGLVFCSWAEEPGVQAVEAAWVAALRSNSVDGIMACYAPDAVGWFPGAPEAKGETAIRAVYAGILASNTIHDAALSDTHYATVGKQSVGWGKYWIILVDKATGYPTVWSGRFTEVAEQRDNRWLFIVDHTSPEVARPAATKK